MNEIELLRNQLATERRRVREVASACAAAYRAEPAMCDPEALAALRGACTAYLGCVLDWFDRRDERLRELSAPRPGGDAGRALEAALNLSGRGRAALASNPRVADWRAFGGIDADSVWQERALYACFRAALPAGSRPGPA